MNEEFLVYVGNWNVPTPEAPGGVSVFRFSVQDGELKEIDRYAEKINVGAMALDEKEDVLYLTDERTGEMDAPGGTLLSYRIDRRSSALREVDRISSLGAYPSKIALHSSGRFLLMTNLSSFSSVCRTDRDEAGNYYVKARYDESNLVLFRHTPDGRLEKAVDIAQYHEQGRTPLQSHAMAHSVTGSPSGKLFLVCDKGSDSLRLYKIDEEHQRLALCSKCCASVPESGPRYAVFHPSQPVFYHNNELQAYLCVYGYDEDGRMQHVQTISMLPEGMTVSPNLGMRERPSPSDLVLSPDGSCLYAALRQLNQILVFAVDPQTGILAWKQTADCGGKNPRGLAIDPTGRYLLSANLDSGAVAVLRIEEDGVLQDTGKRGSAPDPGCILFV